MGMAINGVADGLTRTTLQIEDGSSAPSIAAAIRALQRVPGVLLADMHPASTRAVVAHDAAVDPASFLRAVAFAGIRASIVDESGVSTGPKIVRAPLARVLATVGVVLVPLAFTAIFLSGAAGRQWLLPLISLAYFAVFFARSILARKK